MRHISNRSIGTSIGMRRWWARQPKCPRCNAVKLRNKFWSRLCASCTRISNAEKENPGRQVEILLRYGKEPVARQRFRADRKHAGELVRLHESHVSGYEFHLRWWNKWTKDECIGLMFDDFDILTVLEIEEG